MKTFHRFLFATLLATTMGCAAASEDNKPPPGRCMVSADCPETQTCRNTRCEDIYHPRREIKPY